MKSNLFKNKSILLTGGTGSFGQKFTEIFSKFYNFKKLIIFSRDELKQSEMRKKFSPGRIISLGAIWREILIISGRWEERGKSEEGEKRAEGE